MLKALVNVAASQTDSELIAARTGKVIKVYGFMLTSVANTQFTFNSKGAGAGVAISMLVTVPTVNAVVFPLLSHPNSYFDTASGESLTSTSGTGNNVRGIVFYQYVNP